MKLPASACGNGGQDDTIDCLSEKHQAALERDIGKWEEEGWLKAGQEYIGLRPGSYVVIVREWFQGNDEGLHVWSRYFFCQNWEGPSGRYKIVFDEISGADEFGACYIDKQNSINV